MATENDNKREARIDYRLPIRIEDVEAGINYNAEMINFNKNGMYFETDCAFQPGANIFIGIEESPYTSESGCYECYRAEIVWRRKLKIHFIIMAMVAEIFSLMAFIILQNTIISTRMTKGGTKEDTILKSYLL